MVGCRQSVIEPTTAFDTGAADWDENYSDMDDTDFVAGREKKRLAMVRCAIKPTSTSGYHKLTILLCQSDANTEIA